MIDPSTFVAPVQKGERPLTASQFSSRINDRKRRVLSDTAEAVLLATDPEGAKKMAEVMQMLLNEAALNNLFNHQRAEYHAAVGRLIKHRLADGRPEIIEHLPTGKYDAETGDPITEPVVTQTVIDPLPPTVIQPQVDEDGEPLGAITVPNPLIVQDDAERAAAQAVIDATPQEVKDWMQT